jgi:hypothetical protein
MQLFRTYRRRRLVVAVALVVGTAIGAARLAAQQQPTPGPEHAVLKEAAGDWDAVIKAQGAESKGSFSSKLALGGLWLIEEFKGDMGGMTFEGRGATSYDAAKKKYVNVWIDSVSTSPMISEGSYDKSTKTLSLTGQMPMPDGTTMKVKQTTVTKDANTRLFTLKGVGPDGSEMEMIQITYKRRANKAARK